MQSHDNLRCSPYGDSFGPIQDSVHWVQHMYRALQPHFKVYPTKSAVASTQEQMQREPKQYSFHKCLQNLRKPFWRQVAVCVCVCVHVYVFCLFKTCYSMVLWQTWENSHFMQVCCLRRSPWHGNTGTVPIPAHTTFFFLTKWDACVTCTNAEKARYFSRPVLINFSKVSIRSQ